MKKSEALFGLVRIPLDVLAVLAALLLSFRLRQENIDLLPFVQLLEPARSLPDLPFYVSRFVVPGIVLFLGIAASLGLYVLRATRSAWTEMGRVSLATLLWVVVINAWFFFVLKQLFFSRALLLHAAFFVILFTGAMRASLILLQRAFLRTGVGRMLVVSLGSHPLAENARDTLACDIHYHYLGHLPSMEALRRIVYQQPIDLVVQTDPNPRSEGTVALIDFCRSHHVGYAFLPPVLADVPHLLVVERLGLLPLIRFRPTPLDGWGRVLKRLFDILISAFLLLFLSPFLLLIAAVILLTGGRPILYVSTRVGEQGRRLIRIIKFRSMVRNADVLKEQLLAHNHRHDGPLFKMKDDPRVTRVGRFLRRWTLDELPQLWNVLIGQVSLVGPRPHLQQEVDRYTLEHRRVFAVKPGMTGLAQVSGRSSLTFDEEVRLDLQYIEEWSPLLDLWILWRTVFTVLSRKGAD
ncbi:MAG: exopolysaccharide biosynthesis polyprenyl glycosylphosphotransferase [Candidatus Peribacteraceae bacterium]|nr:exopolysaccharide biosynthesis polyprenyl glycosylphosphotransferase [Candidatus Peribacteraceae bacterium]